MRSSELYTMTSKIHEKKGTWIYIVRLDVTVEPELFKKLRAMAKEDNGYYSTYRDVHGFVFKHESDADDFCDTLDDTLVITDDEEEQPTSHNSEYITVESLNDDDIDEDDDDQEEDDDQNEDEVDDAEDYEDDTDIEDIGHESAVDFEEASGLKLNEAIKYIIDQDGEEAILNPKIVNILSDLHAFNERPSAKYVLRAIISEGYSRKLLSIGRWNVKAQRLESIFVNATGFQSDLVDFIFQSVAYGLGWKSTIDFSENNQSKTTLNQSRQNGKIQKPTGKFNAEKWEDYLESLIEWKIDFKKRLGADCNISITVDTDKHFRVFADLEGKSDNSVAIYVAIYDDKGKMRVSRMLLYTGNKMDGYYSQNLYVYEIACNKVGRIVIRAEIE